MSTDSVTVLTAHNRRQAKRITSSGVEAHEPVKVYDLAEEHFLGNLDDMERLLRSLITDVHSHVIRGALLHGPKLEKITRTIRFDPKSGNPVTIKEIPRQYVALDMDGVPLPEGTDPNNLLACADAAFKLLPPAFLCCDCIVQASSSHGIKEGARLRLWFWLSRPTFRHELNAWFREVPKTLDRAVFIANQPIFTAAPVFADGMVDPIKERLFRFGGEPFVDVPVFAPAPARKAKSHYGPATIEDIREALALIPNDDADRSHYITIGLATWAASGGSDDGYEAWDRWAAKSSKYTEGNDDQHYARWQSFSNSPPDNISMGTLVYWAQQTDSTWHPSSTRKVDVDDEFDPEFLTEPEAIYTELDAVIADFNRKFMVVNENGKALVYHPQPIEGSRHISYDAAHTFEDFKRLYCNVFVYVDDIAKAVKLKLQPGDEMPKKRLSATTVWLESSKRREFLTGVVFEPNKSVGPGVLNLWQGFTKEPRPGDWSLMRTHIRNIICSGVEEHFDYVMNWLAQMFQNPGDRGGVAIVMRGGEGIGKGTFVDTLLALFGRHGRPVHTSNQVVGRFNGHLRDTVLLYADEAFFAGDKQSNGALKAIITESSLTFENKNRNPVPAPNYLHLIMSSNEEWVVPAGSDSRRFFVIDVSNAKQDNFDYFSAILAERNQGGYEAMLYELLHRDISQFNVFKFPKTRALYEQRAHSMTTIDFWLQDCLMEEKFSEHQTDWGYADRPGWFSTTVLYDSYLEATKKSRDYRPKSKEEFGKYLATYGFEQCRVRVEGDRYYGYHLGDTVGIARQAFDQVRGLQTNWPSNVYEFPLQTHDLLESV